MSGRKSKRRSSFAAGRIRLEHGGALGGEICTNIDNEKPQEERLALLTAQCLQYTLQKLEEEMTNIESFQCLKKEIEDEVLRTITDMRDNGVFKKACTKENYLQNPINIEMDEAITLLEEQTQRLQEESDKWDTLISTLDEKLVQVEKETQSEEISDEMLPVLVKSLASEYLCDNINYTDLIKNVHQNAVKGSLLIDEHAKNVKLMKQGYTAAERLLKQHTNVLRREELRELTSSSPRKLISNLLSLPSIKSEV